MYVARSSAVAARLLEDEMVIMCPQTSQLFVLNPVGTAIWNALDGGTPLAEIVRNHICGQFEVEFETAAVHARDFVQQLAGHGILLISEQPIVSGVTSEAQEAI